MAAWCWAMPGRETDKSSKQKQTIVKKDLRPYWVFKAQTALNKMYVRHYLAPQFKSIGKHANFLYPRYVEVNGPNVSIGDYFSAMARRDSPIRFHVWNADGITGEINIGDYTILSSGLRIASAASVTIGDSCQIAEECYITDADWHGLYHRILTIGETKPVHIGDNVWLGNRATVCKGVHIGENSIVAANSTVVHDVPANTIVAGNPATVVKTLDPDHPRTTRKDAHTAFGSYSEAAERLIKKALEGNTFLGWVRSLFLPVNHA